MTESSVAAFLKVFRAEVNSDECLQIPRSRLTGYFADLNLLVIPCVSLSATNDESFRNHCYASVHAKNLTIRSSR